ncbi:hypothetical protein QUF80_19425 [Desulfococcaceae bacterium HSG8]|nr:hypothetical protein [Desulfococcaceae bacterium HSG8]
MYKSVLSLILFYSFICLIPLNPNLAQAQLSWEQINESGFGFSNKRASDMAVFNSNLYVGTLADNQAGDISGAQVWRYDDSKQWTQVNEDGFGATANMAIQGMIVFQDAMYVGTTNNSAGCEVWRYSDDTWTKVNESGFGEGAMVARIFAVLDESLYVGVRNDTGGADENDHENMTGSQVWRYSGSGTGWTKVSEDGFGNIPSGYNRSVESMAVLNGELYAGTWNDDDGCQVWRYDGGTDWTKINENGFGKAPFEGLSVALALEIFDEHLYVGTRNDDDGAEVWRYDGGSDWTQINKDGFGTVASQAVWDMTEYDGKLCAGTFGGQVMCYDGDTDWTQINETGFGSSANNMVTSMTVLNEQLIAGTDNTTEYSQVWSARSVIQPGDIDCDGIADLGDAILALRILLGINGDDICIEADMDGGKKIGLEDVIWILREISQNK